jgi:rubrerythrin
MAARQEFEDLSMIDENLCRNELSPAERATQTARRKVIYEELHPGAKAGKVSANARWHADEKLAPAFSTETAKATNQSERIVQLNVERGTEVIGEVMQMISGTKLDTGTYLDKLKRLTPNEQVTAAKRDLAQEKAKERDRLSGIARRYAKPVLSDDDVTEHQYAALVSAWNKAGEAARHSTC